MHVIVAYRVVVPIKAFIGKITVAQLSFLRILGLRRLPPTRKAFPTTRRGARTNGENKDPD
jgi:hypothetical protein